MGSRRGCWVRTVADTDTPALWLLDMLRRAAYGLPQALPGSKMVSAGADWATNYQTQLKWFWGYWAQRYGSIQGAYTYWQAHHCY